MTTRPHYRTEATWKSNIDKAILAVPHVVNKLDAANDISEKSYDRYSQQQHNDQKFQKSSLNQLGDLNSSIQQIPSQFNSLNSGIRELSSFAKDLNTIQTKNNTLLSEQNRLKKEQSHISQSILDSASERKEIQSKILEFTSVTNQLITKQLNIQERQLIILKRADEQRQQQIELESITALNSQLSLSLEQAQLKQLEIQTSLMQMSDRKLLAKGKLDSLCEYFKSEVIRIQQSNILPDIVKYLLVKNIFTS